MRAYCLVEMCGDSEIRLGNKKSPWRRAAAAIQSPTLRLVPAVSSNWTGCFGFCCITLARAATELGLRGDANVRLCILDGAGAVDPLAAVLLLARARPGTMLTVAIIAGDVALNGWVGATRGFQVDAFIAASSWRLFESIGCGDVLRVRSGAPMMAGFLTVARGP